MDRILDYLLQNVPIAALLFFGIYILFKEYKKEKALRLEKEKQIGIADRKFQDFLIKDNQEKIERDTKVSMVLDNLVERIKELSSGHK